MAAITVSATGVTNIDAITGKQGNDTYAIAGDPTSTLLFDQDSRFGLNTTPLSGGMSTITPSQTLGGTPFYEGRYIRLIPYNTGTGSVPPPGVTISQGSASGKLIGVYSALNVMPESVGAAMPASGYIKIKAWNDVPFTSGALTIPSTTGTNLVSANVSSFEGILAASDMVVTAGTAVLSNSSTFAQSGTKSLRIAPSATTTVVTKMANGTRFMIGAGLAVTVSAYIRGSDVKSCTVDIEWFDSTNASISTTTIQTQNCSNSAFTQYTSAPVTAPANTKWASVNITVTTPTNGGFYYVDNITVTPGNWSTGATATAADRVGWMEVVGVEGALDLISSANMTYQSDRSMAKGSWFEIGTTDGNRSTTYQVPTNGAITYHGGFLVDKAVATTITNITWSGGVATITSNSHGLTTGDRVFIDEVLPIGYTNHRNLTERCTVVNANTITIPMATNPGSYVSGGKLSAVEWYPTTTAANNTVRTEKVPGMVCWLDSATGLLRFGNDGTTSTGGYIPGAGLKIRMGNIVTSAVATGYATPLTNALNAAVANRKRYYAGNAGIIVVSHLSGSWSPSVFQTGKYVTMRDCSVVGQIAYASQALPSELTFCCTGGNGATTATQAFSISQMLGGITVNDNCFGVGDVSGTRIGINISTGENITGDGNKIIGTGIRANASSWGFNLNIGRNSTFTNTTIANCGGVATSSQFSAFTANTIRYWGSDINGVPVANPMNMFTLTNISTGWLVDGLYVDQPRPFNVMRSVMVSTASSSNDGTFRNMGTYASPIDAGSATRTDKAVSRSTTTATVTDTAHGLRTGDVIMVITSTDTTTSPISSWQSAIAIGVKTVTVVDANTFTFTCTNAGSVTGTIDYYISGQTGSILSMTAKNIVMQNIHVRSNSASPINGSTSSDTVRMENCTFDYRFYSSAPFNRSNFNQIYTSGYLPSYEYQQPTAAVFGLHYSDYYVRPETTAGTDTVVSGATWTRAGGSTTIVVTKNNHGLMHNERIYIENALSGGSSAQATIPNGVKELTLSVVDKNTFTITGVNTGATSGTLDYRLPGDGYIQIAMNDVSSATSSYVTLTGTAAFTGAGTLYAPAVNDSVIWETPNWMIGWDHMAKFPAYLYGSGVTSSQFDLFYDINTGSGFSGSYKNLAYNRGGASGSAGATTFTVTNSTGVNVGDYVYGIGIAGGAKVTNNNTGTNTITVDTAHTGAVSGNIIFNYAPNQSTFPSSGVKFRIKLVTNTTNTATIYQANVGMVSTSTTRARLYNQASQYTLTLSGLQSGSDISIRTAGVVGTALVNVDANSGSTYAYTYYYAAGAYVDIDVYKAGYKVAEVKNYLLTAANVTYPLPQTADLEYA